MMFSYNNHTKILSVLEDLRIQAWFIEVQVKSYSHILWHCICDVSIKRFLIICFAIVSDDRSSYKDYKVLDESMLLLST